MAVSAIAAVSPQEIPHFKSGVDTVPDQRAVRLAPGVDGYDIGVRLPAGPGRYVVTIEVSDG